MPAYDYECARCGPFETVRPMAEYAAPCACPHCGETAPRTLSTPALAGMDVGLRKAHATNETASHAPRLASQREETGRRHGAGCSCCSSSGKKAGTLYRPDGSKSFPAKRPWMISH